MHPIAVNDLELTRFFFALVLLLGCAHCFGYVFQRFLSIPKVIGEIAGGLVLGPTVLGYFFPGAYTWTFQTFASQGQLIATISSIGLMWLMFLSGFEMKKSIKKGDTALIASILLGSTLIPFMIGFALPHVYDFSAYIGQKGNMLSFTIVVAIAIAVTSIPVISKIFLDLGISTTRFATIVLATATLEDVILWVALAIATSLAGGGVVTTYTVVSKVLLTLTFFAAALLVLPLLFERFNALRLNLFLKSSAPGYILLICMLFTAIAGMLNINSIFGAFVAGLLVSTTSHEKIQEAKGFIKEIGMGFFIPIYFAVVGLKLDLVHHFDVLFFLGFLCFAVFVKLLGTVLAAKCAKQNWLSSVNIGIAMNARGGPGIVLATVAFDLGIINENFFVVLIALAIVTSLVAGYWLRFVLARGWPLLK